MGLLPRRNSHIVFYGFFLGTVLEFTRKDKKSERSQRKTSMMAGAENG